MNAKITTRPKRLDLAAQVAPVVADEQGSAITTMTLAFADDPVARWCWRDTQRYLEAFPVFVRAFAGNAFPAGSAFQINACAGAALWLPPGVGPDELAVAKVIETMVPDELREPLFMMLEQMGHYHPERQHWYLPLIGVQPMHQGSGLGSVLMRPILQRCDEQRLPAYLESTNPRNIPFYERLGFRRVGRVQVGTSPVIVPMVREPVL
jgi:GNAT superfamily N-acetyltransferase